MKIITTILKAPLFHFLILGAFLFVAYDWINAESAERDDQYGGQNVLSTSSDLWQ